MTVNKKKKKKIGKDVDNYEKTDKVNEFEQKPIMVGHDFFELVKEKEAEKKIEKKGKRKKYTKKAR